MTDNNPFVLRSAVAADIPFIFNSLLKSYRDAPAVQGIPNGLYYAAHHAVVERILSDAGLRLIVACNPDDSAQIYGYGMGRAAGDVRVIDWIYVKHPFRGYRVGSTLEQALLASIGGEGPVHYTHRVKQVDRLLKDRSYTYNPYLLPGAK